MARSRRAEHEGIRLLNCPNRQRYYRIGESDPVFRGSDKRGREHATNKFFYYRKRHQKLEGGEIAHSVFVSNEPAYINHFHYIFEDLWRNAIDVKTRIASIKHGTISEIEVISNASRVAYQ